MPHEFLDHAWQGFTTMTVGFSSIVITMILLCIGLRKEKKLQDANKDEHH